MTFNVFFRKLAFKPFKPPLHYDTRGAFLKCIVPFLLSCAVKPRLNAGRRAGEEEGEEEEDVEREGGEREAWLQSAC